MASLPQARVCQMHCPVSGCTDLLPLPVGTEVFLSNGKTANTLTCAVEVTPDCSQIWEHLRSKHGLVREV